MMKLKVKVIPNARQNKLVEQGPYFKVYLTAPAVEGKANEALILFLADNFKVKKNQIRIILGKKTRNKVVEIKE
jgi:uncharacterized protein